MDVTTIIIIVASIGFIIMGFVMLNSKKLKDILSSSNIYKDTEKYVNFNGKFNILMGIVGIGLGILNYLLSEKSNYIVISFIATILILTTLQKIIGKKYKVS